MENIQKAIENGVQMISDKNKKNVTESYLNHTYAHKGKTFNCKEQANHFMKSNPKSRLTRLIRYADKDILDSGAVKIGAKKITAGWLVTLK